MAIAKRHGFTDFQIADWEVLMTIAAITNAIPISFWMLSYILADPELASSVLDELKPVVAIKELDGVKTAEIDAALIRVQCPLLISIWEELLRFTSQPTLGRSVTKEIVLNNEYLLKAGGVVQIPTGIPQSDASFWGPDSAILNPRRFIKKDEKLNREEREQKKLQNRAYTPFGGGKNLCPGRHIAANETLSFVSMMIYAFSITNKDGTHFKVIEAAQKAFGASVPKAENDVEVVIKRREELRGVKLGFAAGDSSQDSSG
jgi:cytochrome P450